MDVQTILLGFLMFGSMTGYELKKFFEMSFSFFSGLSYGSIYPALKRMEKEGLITMELQVQDGTPNRKVYTITDSGRTAFVEGLKAPVEFERRKHPLLSRLFFFSFLPPRTECASWKTTLGRWRRCSMRSKPLGRTFPSMQTSISGSVSSLASGL